MMEEAGDNLRAGRRGRRWGGVLLLGLCLTVPLACMTPERAVREADEAGVRIASAYWQQQTGGTNAFDVSRPADALALRIALLALARGERGVVFPEIPFARPTFGSNAVVRLTLSDALGIAARNDRRYQRLKDDVFFRALDVDYQQYLFETSFSGLLLGTLTGDPGLEQASGQATAGFGRKLSNGTELAGQLAFDVVSLLRDDWRSAGVAGDLTVSVPLLRGAGREIVREPLTQAERNLVYALRVFERYRQTYAVSVASGYYSVLELAQRLSNARDNEGRLGENNRRAERMFEAGRMQRIQVDQAKTDLLKAGESVIASAKSYEAQLDAFKVALGLPPESRIELDPRELQPLTERIVRELAQGGEPGASSFPAEEEALRIALAERHDLVVARAQLDDALRGVAIAADALRADMTLTGKASLDRRRETGGGGLDGGERINAGLRTSLPWNRRKERNAYKRQLVAFEQAKRALEELEDSVKQTVRNDMRNLEAARASYRNQMKAMDVAVLRVESNNLYMQSGRSSMRDVLEAESALLAARNALCSAMIQWRLGELELRRDLGVLVMTEAGVWRETGGVEP